MPPLETCEPHDDSREARREAPEGRRTQEASKQALVRSGSYVRIGEVLRCPSSGSQSQRAGAVEGTSASVVIMATGWSYILVPYEASVSAGDVLYVSLPGDSAFLLNAKKLNSNLPLYFEIKWRKTFKTFENGFSKTQSPV